MPYTLPSPQPRAPDGTGTAGLQVTTFAGPSPVVEIHHFFTVYKELEPGKSVRDTAWANRAAAEAEIEASRQRLREQADGTHA